MHAFMGAFVIYGFYGRDEHGYQDLIPRIGNDDRLRILFIDMVSRHHVLSESLKFVAVEIHS